MTMVLAQLWDVRYGQCNCVGCAIATSHAAGRVGARSALAAFLALARVRDIIVGQAALPQVSSMAVLSVVVLALMGWMLSRAYINSGEALYGAAYGLMFAAKTILFAIMLIPGALTFLIIRQIAAGPAELILTLRPFTEAEVGIGFTIVLAAASLSSQPPAVDLTTGRLQLSELVQRWSPRWPSLTTPSVDSLSKATPLGFDTAANVPRLQSFIPGASYQPNTPDDIAWSEYNPGRPSEILIRVWPVYFILTGAILLNCGKT